MNLEFKGWKKDALIIAGILIPFIIFYGFSFSEFKQIPSPLYGGDYYFHYGITQHIENGNAPWTDPQINGEYAFYGWLYHSLVAYTSNLLGLDLFKTFIFFPLVALILSGVVVYFLGKKLFDKDYWSVILTFAWLATANFMMIHPRPFAHLVLIPLFLLAFIYFREEPSSWKRRAYLGGVLGALGLTHLMSFVNAGFFMIVFAGYEIISNSLNAKNRFEGVKEAVIEVVQNYWFPAVLGFVISMPYLAPLLFVYKFHALNPQPSYSSPIWGFGNLYGFLKGMFFNYASVSRFLMSLLVLLGFVYAYKKRDELKFKVLIVAFLALLIGQFYYFFTRPLGIDFSLYWQMSYLGSILRAVLLTVGAIVLINSLKKDMWKRVAIGLVALLLVFTAVSSKVDYYSNNRWVEAGRSELTPMFEVADWVEANTEKNSVFLSTNELSFAINALTGRKIVVNRGTHMSQFVDWDERKKDVAIILYGNDNEKRKELLRKYSVDYVYFDNSWGQSMQWDPFLVRPDNKEELDMYNVSYQEVNTKLDPGKENVPTYDLLFIQPTVLWTQDFNSMVYPIQLWGTAENPRVVIFKVNESKLV